MGATGLAVFDKTLQETNIWIKRLMECLGTDDREQAYMVLKATLHALRDLMGPENAAHLAAQLPILLRGVYYEGWHVAGTPSKERRKEAFFEHVRRGMRGIPDCDTELVVRSVFEVMWNRIDQGEIAKLIRIFPRDLRQLWTGAQSQGLSRPTRAADGPEEIVSHFTRHRMPTAGIPAQSRRRQSFDISS
jgi:uncharacterized protein (DUF2267 family)